MRIKKTPHSIPFFLFIFLLIFAPLAFGTVELWSIAVVEFTTALAVLILIWEQKKATGSFKRVPGALPLFLLLIWITLQLIPLPPSIIEFVSPGSYSAYQPIFKATGQSEWISLTVNKKATIFELIRIASYMLFYFLTVQLLGNGKRLQLTVKIIVFLAILLAFFAIIQKLAFPDLIYGLREAPERSKPMGPWIHRSQFAGFMTMILPLIIGLLLYYKPRLEETANIREKIISVATSPNSNYQLLLGFGAIIVLFSILLTLSRGGMIVCFVSLFLYYIILNRKKKTPFWGIFLLFGVGIILYFLNFGFSDVVRRIDDSISVEGVLQFSRLDLWRDTLEAVKVFWLTGSGFGTYEDIFPLFKTLPDVLIYDHAHNDYLELLADGGVIGFFLAGWFVFAVFLSGWRSLRKRRDRFSILFGSGALVGVLASLLYSITDFNMHNGADGLYFFFLCALYISCTNTRFHFHGDATLLPEITKKHKNAFLVLSLATLIAVVVFPVRSYMARQMYGGIEDIYITSRLSKEKLSEVKNTLIKAKKYDPFEGAFPSVLGNVEKYFGDNVAAMNFYRCAALLNPLRGEFLQQIAFMLKDNESLASELMELGYKRSLKRDQLLLNFAEWLLGRDEKARASVVLKQGLEQNQKLIEDSLLLLEVYFEPEEVVDILPDKVSAWIKYGDYLERVGKVQESEIFRKGALQFIANEERTLVGWYYQLYNYYRKQKRAEEAVNILKQAAKEFPDDVSLHILLGDYYQKEGIFYRAREEYEQALIFDPGNENILKKLENLGD